MYNLLYALNVSLMISLPLFLGWLISKRVGGRWRVFLIGGGTFVFAQLIHIPFNYFAFSKAAPWLANLTENNRLLVTAVFAGLSAGIFEEGGRYLTYRYWAKEARSWSQSVMMGAGHGGVEAILIGLLAALNVGVLIGYQYGFFSALVANAGESQVRDIIDGMYQVPWYHTLFGSIERLSALCLQIAFSVIVLQVFTRGNKAWLLLAIGWHALVDAVAVWSVSVWGVEVTEILVGIFAVLAIVTILRLKTPDPSPPSLEQLPEIGLNKAIEIEVTAEKLDNSRYSR